MLIDCVSYDRNMRPQLLNLCYKIDKLEKAQAPAAYELVLAYALLPYTPGPLYLSLLWSDLKK